MTNIKMKILLLAGAGSTQPRKTEAFKISMGDHFSEDVLQAWGPCQVSSELLFSIWYK